MTALLALVIFAAGASIGALVTLSLYVHDTVDDRIRHRSEYASGHSDGAVGIWRDGPLR